MASCSKNEPLEGDFPLNPHQQGAIFFAALEESGCYLDCVAAIWNGLRKLHDQGKKVNTALIKQVTEEVTGLDFSNLFLKAHLRDQYYTYGAVDYPVKK